MFHHSKNQSVDVSRMITCGECFEKPIFFNTADLESHNNKFHQGCDVEQFKDENQPNKTLRLHNIKNNMATQYKTRIGNLQQKEQTIDNALSLLKEEIQCLRENLDDKIKTMNGLRDEANGLLQSIEIKTRQLQYLYKERRKIDQEYYRRRDGKQDEKQDQVRKTPLEAWKEKCEQEAQQAVRSLHSGTRSHERGGRIEGVKPDLNYIMDGVMKKIDVLEQELSCLKNEKKKMESNTLYEEEDIHEIKVRLTNAFETLETKENELEKCKTEIQSLQRKNETKDVKIRDLQQRIKRDRWIIRKLKRQILEKGESSEKLHSRGSSPIYESLYDYNARGMFQYEKGAKFSQSDGSSYSSEEYEEDSDNLDNRLLFEKYTNLKITSEERINGLTQLFNDKRGKYDFLKEKYKKLQIFLKEMELEKERQENFESNRQELERTIECLKRENGRILNGKKIELCDVSKSLIQKEEELEQCQKVIFDLQDRLANLQRSMKYNKQQEDGGLVLDQYMGRYQNARCELAEQRNENLNLKLEQISLEQLNESLLKSKNELESEFNKIKIAVKKFKEENHLLQRDNMRMEDEIHKLKGNIDQLKNHEKAIHYQIEDYKNTIDDIRSTNKCVESENVILQCKCNDYEKEIKVLQQTKTEIIDNHLEQQRLQQQQLGKLEKQLDLRKTDNEKDLTERNRLKNQLDDIQLSLKFKTTKVEEQAKMVADLGKQILRQQETQNEVDAENIRLRGSIELSEREVRNYIEKVEDLKRRLESEIRSRTELEAWNKEKKTDISELEFSKQKFQNDIAVLTKDKNKLIKENEKLKNDLLVKESNIKADSTILKEKIKNLTEENDEKTLAIQELKEKLKRYEYELKDTKEAALERDECKEVIEELKKQLNEKKQKLVDMDSVDTRNKNNVNGLEEELLCLRQELVRSSQAKKDLTEKHQTLKERNREREEKLSILQNEHDVLKQAFDDTRQKQDKKIKKFKKIISEYKSMSDDKTFENTQMEYKDINKKLNEKIKQLMNQLAEKSKECDKYKNDFEKTSAKIEAIERSGKKKTNQHQIEYSSVTKLSDNWDSSENDSLSDDKKKKNTLLDFSNDLGKTQYNKQTGKKMSADTNNEMNQRSSSKNEFDDLWNTSESESVASNKKEKKKLFNFGGAFWNFDNTKKRLSNAIEKKLTPNIGNDATKSFIGDDWASTDDTISIDDKTPKKNSISLPQAFNDWMTKRKSKDESSSNKDKVVVIKNIKQTDSKKLKPYDPADGIDELLDEFERMEEKQNNKNNNNKNKTK